MKNFVLLIHKKREDVEKFIEAFPKTYIYVDMEVESDNPYLVEIEHSSINARNVIGNGIRHIYRDNPGYHVVLVNECTTIDDVNSIVHDIEEGGPIVIATNNDEQIISKKRMLGIKIITKLYNLVHRQKATNIMSNVQGIPSDKVKLFRKLKGDTCSILINERFIIKDNNIDYFYIKINSNVYTDAPARFFGYVKSIFIISFVFIKFMLSSLSAFVVDNSLAFVGYSVWSPLVVKFLASLAFPLPSVMLDVEIVSTAIARMISSVYNYIINKKVVFGADKNVSRLGTVCKYFTLVLIIWVFNTIIMKLGTTYLNIPFHISKIIADIIMYFVSFTAQRDLIFRKRNK